MAKKTIGYGNFYCVFCGERIEKNADRCPRCGNPYGEEKFYGTDALGAGGIGWSDKLHDPTFKRNKKKSVIGSLIFCVIVSFIIFLVMYFEGGAGFEDDGLKTYGIVMAILWAFWLVWLIVTYSRSKMWEGVVEGKDVQHHVSTERDDNGHTYTRESTYYITYFRLTNGKRKKIVNINSRSWYDYLLPGDRVRCHGDKMNYYEKYDKSRDTEIPCASCGTSRDAREIYCGKCGAIMLKGQPMQQVNPMHQHPQQANPMYQQPMQQANHAYQQHPQQQANPMHQQPTQQASPTFRPPVQQTNAMPAQAQTAAQSTGMNFCPGCGSRTDGSKFCGNCGRKLHD